VRIDHVIYAAGDLAGATARVEAALGVAADPGGHHSGLGTHNAILPLGGGYLEVLAVDDPAEARASGVGAALTARLAGVGEGLWAWAVHVDDVAATAERLGSEVMTIVREGLSARITGVAEAMADPALPFFIARDEGVADPGAAGTAGGISWIEVGGDPSRLEPWLGGQTLPVRFGAGAPGVMAIGVGAGELRLR